MFKTLLQRLFCFFGLSLFSLSPLFAASTTNTPNPNGTWLLAVCSGLLTNAEPTPNNNYCAGFIQGVMLSWYTAEQQVNPQGARFWMSQFGSIPAVDSSQMVVKFLGQNPQLLSQGAVSLVIAAINQNYPIPSNNSES